MMKLKSSLLWDRWSYLLVLLLVHSLLFSASAFLLPRKSLDGLNYFYRTTLVDANPPLTSAKLSHCGRESAHHLSYLRLPLVSKLSQCGRKSADLSSLRRFATTSGEEEDFSSSDVGENSWTDGGRVSVTVEKNISTVSDPSVVREAWLKHHWKKGGGLPIFIMQKDEEEEESSDKEEWTTRRVLAPIMMEEEAIVKKDQDSTVTIEYTVTKPGWAFQSDLVDNSHAGSVSVVPIESGKGCKMVWEVEFDTVRLRGLYQAVTEFTIGTAARTVVESLSTPRLLTVKSTLSGISDPIDARKEWLEFFWARGGGLPLPPPIPYGEKLDGGSATRSILRVPPLLVDTVLSTATTSESAEAIYQIENPGWTTLPFLIHTHLGRVRFTKSSKQDDSVDITWEIEVRPFPLVAPLVKKLLEMTASTIVRNLAVHLAEPGAIVEIRPPRGNADLAGGIDSFGSVPKDIWLGGVLDAHLRDNRSTFEQTLSIVQPWTWGRTGNGDKNDIVAFGWSDKSMDL